MSYADEMSATSPSHGVAWARFLPRAFVALLLAAAGAIALEVLLVFGWYLVILAPAGVALAITGAVYMAVSGGHCRNRWLAVALGCLAGAVLYLGHYQVDMARQLGPQFALRVDLLPRYIVFRKQFVDQQKKVGPEAVAPPAANAEKKVDRFGNWYLFAFEFGMSLCFPAWGGYFAAGRPYCDRCRNWRRREAVFFGPGHGPEIVRAYEENRLQLLTGLPAIPPPQQGSYTAMILEWCPPPPGDAEACTPCLSVKAVRRGGGPTLFSQVDAVFGRTLLNMRPLALEQAQALQPRFPSLMQFTLGGKLRADHVER